MLVDPLSAEQESLLEMHSVLNVMGVITYELMMLQSMLPECDALDELIEENADVADILRRHDQAICLVGNISSYISKVRAILHEAAHKRNVLNHPEFESRLDNLNSVFEILETRAAELMAREQASDPWVWHDIADLKQKFFKVFKAIERNSHGGYRIVYNVAEHSERDYLVNLEIDGDDAPRIRMPAVFQDVMRDLLANARKYTPPGGRIIAGLHQSDESLRLVIEDDGAGIPPNEITEVVKFGYRASNMADRVTRGGGFGLTKAFYVARKFGGRMWVESAGIQGEGTRIEIRIPLPPSSDAVSNNWSSLEKDKAKVLATG